METITKLILTFNYPEAKGVVVCGDIHGAFEEMVFKLCVQYGMADTLLIVAGDCGFGFEKPGYHEQIFNKKSRRLIRANNWVVMIPGIMMILPISRSSGSTTSDSVPSRITALSRRVAIPSYA